ncbi:sulfatase-like hydrolase/transferase [Vallitalea pronyensis]|uniref:Sulfatase-like hydrolase/transferase n=1 Tax=Vallitalea pronyensis TaxID=1348613 RepID=A0A8J8MGE0_9FIRM|nr:sulfatase-like hydrolase/transferase [Vallitalea pronyensis]QUI21022.1 sulfatase-like hydrolase/transferase [Vallitalea pronyensis]
MNQQPNILVIYTDQQSASMMSCTGNAYLQTPAMDYLAAQGIRFNRAYCTNPVCIPSRFSLLTGRYPSEIGLKSNKVEQEIDHVPQEIKDSGLGWLLKDAGYDVAYGGKEHLPLMCTEDLGYQYITDDEREGLADTCAAFIKKKRKKPFFLTVSFINPHDICMMAIRDYPTCELDHVLVKVCKKEQAMLDDVLKKVDSYEKDNFWRDICPPLPDNFEPQAHEPEAISMLLKQRPFKEKARKHYTQEQWRLHRFAYCRLTERVDAHIHMLLQALQESGQEDNTVIIFTSDHGDMDGSHRMEHKTALYEECCRIPLIITHQGQCIQNHIDDEHLVSNGLDLYPTICDYAGITIPKNIQGNSLKPIVEGADPIWRNRLIVESEFGKMNVTKKYKHVQYIQGAHSEQLYDLVKDPGEMENIATDETYSDMLKAFRKSKPTIE